MNLNRVQFAPAQTSGAGRRSNRTLWLCQFLILLLSTLVLPLRGAETEVIIGRISNEDATPGFSFGSLPPPTINDAASTAILTLLSGSLDQNGGGCAILNDGQVPAGEDEPRANLFFSAGTKGGVILMDLGRVVEVQQINSYSWHPGTRGPQVYTVYFASNDTAKLDWVPPDDANAGQFGWSKLAKVDTRPSQREMGGQYGVCLKNPKGLLGKTRYLLFDIRPTESRDPFGNTFYGEIDVIDAQAKEPLKPIAWENHSRQLRVTQGKYNFTIDTFQTPDLAGWAETNLVPMIEKWYPEIVRTLSSPGFEAPRKVKIVFSSDMDGVADTAGGRIRCAGRWFRANLQGEATGAVFHELVHVVQSYGQSLAERRNREKVPGWLVEGIADYLRWFRFEPDSRGAEISLNGLDRARFDASYRVTANFLDWASRKYDKELVPKLNAAIRQGLYSEELWSKFTGRSLTDLGAEWKLELKQKLEQAAR